MWDWLQNAANQYMQMGAAEMQQRQFIQSLFTGTQEQAIDALRQGIERMSDEEINLFSLTLGNMINEAQQNLQQAQASSSWGSSYEDQLAYTMAHIQSGSPTSQAEIDAQGYLDGLNAIFYYADQFYQEKQARAAQAALPDKPEAESKLDASELERRLDEMVLSGNIDPGLLQQVMSLSDEKTIDRVLEKLKALGANEGPSPSLNIADYYRPGPGKYTPLWPLQLANTLPLPFNELDRETQFFVLFTEWSRRELEGMAALNSGDLATAQSIFEECLERARQLEVAELKARSYEDMMRVAQRQGDRQAEGMWLEAAIAAREAG